jgi:transposase-like protein
MKTQISKPARERTGYTKEYKQEALSLWRASGRSAAKVAAELGIRPPLLYRWARLERLPEAERSGRKPRRTMEELEAENQRFTHGERQALGAA